MTSTTLRVGDPIMHPGDLDRLPIGATIRHIGEDIAYIKCENGRWNNHGPEDDVDPGATGFYQSINFQMGGANVVDTLPDTTRSRRAESLAQYQWRFRSHVLRAAYENGVGVQRVQNALRELDLFPLGAGGFTIGPEVTIARDEEVPPGTVVYQGDPNNPDRLGVWRRGAGVGEWQKVLGGAGHIDVLLKIATWEGQAEPPAWLTEPGTEEDANEILLFKARSYRVGDRLRRGSSWCGTYDRIMERIGVNALALEKVKALSRGGGLVVGESVTQAEARSLPEGTIFGWVDPEEVGRFAVFRRELSFDGVNLSGTHRIVGNRRDGTVLGNYRAGMRILAIPGDTLHDPDDWAWRLGSTQQWLPHLPPGCAFRFGDNPIDYYVARDGKVSYFTGHRRTVGSTGTWEISQFNNEPLSLIGFFE